MISRWNWSTPCGFERCERGLLNFTEISESLIPLSKMSHLEAGNLFNVKDMVFVVTGGGSGTTPSNQRSKPCHLIQAYRDWCYVCQSARHQWCCKGLHRWSPPGQNSRRCAISGMDSLYSSLRSAPNSSTIRRTTM